METTSFIDDYDFKRIKEFSETIKTPFLVVLLDKIKQNYLDMKKNFKNADIYYAVKANPEKKVLELLAQLGSFFDIASIYELDTVLDIGVVPDKISYGNTIKKAADIKYAYEKGIRLFVTDSESDLLNIIEYAPGSSVYIRLLVEGSEYADWPLARKFGCSIETVKYLISLAKGKGLDIKGLSFHVGSQQRNVFVWEYALLKVKDVFEWAKNEENIDMDIINIGGGLPTKYITETEPLDIYAKNINEFIENQITDRSPRVIIEPGRSLVGDSGVIVTEVILVSKKTHLDHHRWVYLDVGKFNGLIETLDECIKYPIYHDLSDEEIGDVILAGPTCDSVDIMYEDHMYQLPISLKSTDRLYWLSSGAYTSSYASVSLNGFPPIKVYCI